MLLLTFTVGFPLPVCAVDVHDALQLTSNQLVFGWALQGNHRTHVGAIALDDLLCSQGWQRYRRALAWKTKTVACD